MSNTTIQELIENNCDVQLAKDGEYTAVVAGDGVDFLIYIFKNHDQIVQRDQCGLDSHLPYINAWEYLRGFQRGFDLEDILKHEAGVL